MKKIIAFIIVLSCVVLCCYLVFKGDTQNIDVLKEAGVTSLNNQADTTLSASTEGATDVSTADNSTQNRMYAVWLTYSEIGALVKGKSRDEYIQSIQNVFKKLKENKINTVFYQCRAFCDSLYASDIFPVSKYISASNTNMQFDPFEIFLEEGKQYDIAVHCWINPYRVSYDNNLQNLPETSPVSELYKDNKNNLIICDKGIYLNPAAEKSRALVLRGIREILDKYKVEGIHFDDYFYPETTEIADEELYKKYKEQGGLLSLENWRRANVSNLVSSVYNFVKARDKKLIFSISPSADIEKCENVFYADVKRWCSEEGYIDCIIPQIYYGFENQNMPFLKVMEEWEKLAHKSKASFVCGLAPYKCGKIDEYAGAGKYEWSENVNILSQEYERMAQSELWQGFSLFSYSYCFGDNVSQISNKEIKNLLNMVE